MKSNLSKREFLHLFAIGGVAAATGLLTVGKADARKPQSADDLAELAQSLTAINYLAGFAFVAAAIFKFEQHKDNPTKRPLGLISAVWASLDGATASSLATSGYSPYFLRSAVAQAADGDPSDLFAFFNDLKLLSC